VVSGTVGVVVVTVPVPPPGAVGTGVVAVVAVVVPPPPPPLVPTTVIAPPFPVSPAVVGTIIGTLTGIGGVLVVVTVGVDVVEATTVGGVS